MAARITDVRYCVKRIPVNGAHYSAAMANRDRTEFASRVIAARKHAGLTQHGLSTATKIKQSTIAEMEVSGQSSLMTPQIARACGVDAYWLATGEGEMVASHALPFATLTLEMLKSLPPKLLESIELNALGLISLSKTPTLKGLQRNDTEAEVPTGLRVFDPETGAELDRSNPDTGEKPSQRGKRNANPPKRGGAGGL